MPAGAAPRVGFVGLGVMGLPMARNLRSGGFDVAGWARREAAAAAAREAGLEIRPSLAALAADREFVVTMVTASEDLVEVALGPGGLLGSMAEGSILVDMSTVSPEASRQVAELAAERGIGFLDAPVSGGSAGAEAGTLSIMVGGEAETLARCRPLFAAMGNPERLFHVGPVGAGEVVKLVNNMLVGSISAATLEAMLVGVRAGVPLATLVEVVAASSGGSVQLSGQLVRNAFADRFEPGFMTDLLVKDLELARRLAADGGVATPLTDVALDLYRASAARGHGRQDYGALLLMLEAKARTRARI